MHINLKKFDLRDLGIMFVGVLIVIEVIFLTNIVLNRSNAQQAPGGRGQYCKDHQDICAARGGGRPGGRPGGGSPQTPAGGGENPAANANPGSTTAQNT